MRSSLSEKEQESMLRAVMAQTMIEGASRDAEMVSHAITRGGSHGKLTEFARIGPHKLHTDCWSLAFQAYYPQARSPRCGQNGTH